jgi:hypothetical protein
MAAIAPGGDAGKAECIIQYLYHEPQLKKFAIPYENTRSASRKPVHIRLKSSKF